MRALTQHLQGVLTRIRFFWSFGWWLQLQLDRILIDVVPVPLSVPLSVFYILGGVQPL